MNGMYLILILDTVYIILYYKYELIIENLSQYSVKIWKTHGQLNCNIIYVNFKT